MRIFNFPISSLLMVLCLSLGISSCDREEGATNPAAGSSISASRSGDEDTFATEFVATSIGSSTVGVPEFPILADAQVRESHQRMRALFVEENWTELDQELASLLSSKAYTFQGEIAYTAAIKELIAENGLSAQIQNWVMATDSTHSHATSTGIDVKKAWAVRGNGWASTVQEDQWKGFRDHLLSATKHAEKSLTLEPLNIAALNQVTKAHMGLGSSPETFVELMETSANAHPGDSRTLEAVAYALLPRWLGSAEIYFSVLDAKLPETAETLNRFMTLLYVLKYTSDWDGPTEDELSQNGIGVKRLKELIDRYETVWPGSSRFREESLEILYDERNRQAVLAISEEGMEKFGKNGFLLLAKGRALVNTRQYAQALPVLEEAIGSDDGEADFRPHGWLATAFYRMNRNAEARPHYLRALELIPEDETFFRVQYHNRLCLGGSATNDHDFAIEHGTKAISLDSQNSYAPYYRGYAYAEMGEKKKAKADFLLAIQIDPKRKPAIDKDMPGWDKW